MKDDPALINADITYGMNVLIRDFFGPDIRLDKFQLEMTSPDGEVHLSWALNAKTL